MPSPLARKPRWLLAPAPTSPAVVRLGALLRRHRLHTVCESATCPNRGRCWGEGSAAFLILGALCTRRCAFCDVPSGRPLPPDADEPQRLAAAARELELRHVVVTSVSRDDLADGGADHFAACIAALRGLQPAPTVEVLTPDFRPQPAALARVLAAGPQVFNHNVETVPRLYPTVRPAADYAASLALLAQAAAWPGDPAPAVKSGLMLGLGESLAEVRAVLADLRQAGVALLTIGQYLRPGLDHHPVVHYWEPAVFEQLRAEALAMGFRHVESHPLARSSFHAAAALAP